MGGDHGPAVVVPALGRALQGGLAARFLLHGDAGALNAALARFPDLQGIVEVRHADKVIGADEKPAQAMRRGKGSSMWNAVEAVKTGEAAACVSAGNTGALMAIAMLVLRMLADMERPALVASWPTLTGRTAVLDVGANLSADAQRLVEFAILGAAFHHSVHGSARPSVGVLNVGSEDQKGHEEVREANRILREITGLELDYRGFVEGDDIPKGMVDVVVTDGFTGNVALKTGEGLARYFFAQLRAAFTSGPFARLGALIASAALRRMAGQFDPSSINAAPFLGLNGIVVKSHGSADARGFATSIRLAADLAGSDFVAQIDRNLRTMTAAMPNEAAPDAAGERTKA
ncbi:MAG TPA: phosphate acyltransferase PlsX [Caulobacteraceae bacterium]|nr:phosphate acyltransferase PlsX [Caulobacteraceae bacterium]